MADSNDIRSSVESAASKVGEQASQMASTAGKRVDEATAALGERIQSAAGTLRERGPQEGMLGTATGAVADSMEHAGRYVQDEGIVGIAEDLTELIRRNPIPAMFVGVGIGYLLAKLMRR